MPHPASGMSGEFDRWRRSLRRRILEPVLVNTRSFRETVLNALAARGHLILCRLPDASFFVDPSDRTVGTHLAWNGDWQRAEVERAISTLRAAGRLPSDAVFVDVGANIGTQTVYAMLLGTFARAVAIEPEPRNLELLAMNVAINKLAARVELVGKAAGVKAGTEWLYLHPRNKGNHTLGRAPSRDGLERMEVPVDRLDAILADHAVEPETVGLIWIDAEGSEPDVVAGLGRYLDAAPPLVLEYAPARYDEAARTRLLATLEQHYSHALRLDGNHAPQSVAALKAIAASADVLVY
jgi:FkbM family methyltransferase